MGDDLGLDGFNIGGVGLLGLGARVQEAAVGQLQHGVAVAGRRRVQGERAGRQIALMLLLLLRRGRDDGAERGRRPWEVAVAMAAGAKPEVVRGDVLHGRQARGLLLSDLW